jgi:flagellar protein FlbD
LKEKREERGGDNMIVLHKMNNEEFMLNSNHIETIEERPDTVITMTNERKYLVKESIDEIMKKVKEYQRSILFPDSE